jgi:hypothetical protein
MKLTIEVTLQDKSFDKVHSKLTIEQRALEYLSVGEATQTLVSNLIADTKYPNSPFPLPEPNVQLAIPLD